VKQAKLIYRLVYSIGSDMYSTSQTHIYKL